MAVVQVGGWQLVPRVNVELTTEERAKVAELERKIDATVREAAK